MQLHEVYKEAEEFPEWESYNRSYVTYASAMLFAQQCAKLAVKREADKDRDDLK